MRHTLFTLMFVLLMVPQALAQENKTQDQKSTTMAETTKPKSEVDRLLAEAAERGETIVRTCITDDCKKDSEKQDGVETGRAIRLPKPSYPEIARAAHAEGEVEVRVIIGEDGTVIAAAAISGHPLLQATSVSAARDALFAPTLLHGKAVKVNGVIKYTFQL